MKKINLLSKSLFTPLLLLTIAMFSITHLSVGQEYVPDSNTVALWHFNETSGSTVSDGSGNGHDGFATGTAIAGGRFGQGRKFLGTGDSINVDRTDFKLAQFTVEAWIYIDSMAGSLNHFIVSNMHSGVDMGFFLDVQPITQQVLFTVGSGVGSDYHLFSASTINEKQWYHIAATYDGDSMKIFINGVKDAAAAWTNLSYEVSNTYPLKIGNHNLNPWDPPDQFFDGTIDEIRISNIARQPSEFNVPSITGLVAYYPFNGNANDESGNGNNGTVNGATLDSNRFSEDQKAYGFNGTDNSIEVPHSSSFLFNSTKQFTMAAWIKIRNYNHQAIAFKGGAVNPPGYFCEWAVVIEPDHTLRFKVNANADNTSYSYLSSSPTLQLNKWSQVVAMWDGTANIMALYLDGQVVGSTAAIDSVVSMPDRPLYLGFVGDGPFDGELDDIRIYNRALSATKIDSLYHEGGWAAPPEPAIVSISDILSDQGGKVRIKWNRISLDSNGTNPQVTSYGVWRKIPTGSIARMKPRKSTIVANDTLGTLYDFLGSVPAVQSPQYNFVALTLQDSSASGSHAEQYLITAHTSDPNVYFISDVASGYSVDNLAPLAPAGLIANVHGGSQVQLAWDSPTDPDIDRYYIYRSTTIDFTPSPSSKIGQSTQTTFTDTFPLAGTNNYYRIVAIDFHDNASQPSAVAGAPVTVSQTFSARDKWNIVSVPLTVGDYSKKILYPTAVSNAFAYQGSYVLKSCVKKLLCCQKML